MPVDFRDMETMAGSTNWGLVGAGVGTELTMVAEYEKGWLCW